MTVRPIDHLVLGGVDIRRKPRQSRRAKAGRVRGHSTASDTFRASVKPVSVGLTEPTVTKGLIRAIGVCDVMEAAVRVRDGRGDGPHPERAALVISRAKRVPLGVAHLQVGRVAV